MGPPPQWPNEVVDQYEPLRVLGKGGFASVVLAKKKDAKRGEKDKFVAMKVVAASTDSEVGYAHREMYILRELSHSRIMRLVNSWEPSPSSKKAHNCAAVLALSYAKGPTLDDILKKGGAPSIVFSRVVLSQLVDAVAYLHSHAVLHRDIKPDNLVITGASLSQDEIWEDEQVNPNLEPDFEELREKWHATLVDFGFARALARDEVERRDGGLRSSVVGKPSTREMSASGHSDLNEALDLSSSQRGLSESNHSSVSGSSRRRSGKLDRSYSRVMVRRMSALGNRNFAAPEVMKGVKQQTVTKDGHTLSEFVSDYGMVADAFSVGATIRYTLSGVPPSQNIEETIASKNNPMAKTARWLGKRLKKPKDGAPKKRKKKYRSISDFPGEVIKLIKGLTHWNPKERTTVRTARLYPWIDDALEDAGHWKRGEAQYLECASMNFIASKTQEQ